MKHGVVVRVTATEFETSDGVIHPHGFHFKPDDMPSPEEFQQIYDLLGPHEKERRLGETSSTLDSIYKKSGI